MSSQWAPLEAKKPQWKHRSANVQQTQADELDDRQTQRTQRWKLTLTYFLNQRQANDPSQIEYGKPMVLVPNLQIPVYENMKSLEELRRETRSNIKEKPRVVTIDGKAPEEVYMVCPKSYDREYGTVEVLRATDIGEQKEYVLWRKCVELQTELNDATEEGNGIQMNDDASRQEDEHADTPAAEIPIPQASDASTTLTAVPPQPSNNGLASEVRRILSANDGDHYSVLGVTSRGQANLDDIKSCFKNLALRIHPDKRTALDTNSAGGQQVCDDAWNRILLAYEVITKALSSQPRILGFQFQ